MKAMTPEEIAYGQALFNVFAETEYIETTGWAPERLQRVFRRIQETSQGIPDFNLVDLWIEQSTAFTAPGNYIYFSRRLLECCRNDEMAAMVVGHELAHHELGHLSVFPDWLGDLPGKDLNRVVLKIVKSLGNRCFSPRKECDADIRGLEFCMAAGYEPRKCIELFDLLEQTALNYRDLDVVYGPDESDDELDEDAPFKTKLDIWLFQLRRGTLPIRDRRQALIKYLAKREAGGVEGVAE